MDRKKVGTRAEPYVKKDGTATRGTTVYMPVEIAERLRRFAFNADRKQNDIVVEAIRKFLDMEEWSGNEIAPIVAVNNDRRMVERKGRIRSDGTRTDSSPKIRSTVYLNPAIDQHIRVHSAIRGQDRSTIIGEALARWIKSEEINGGVQNGK